MADALPTLTSISEALDSLGIAMCVFDEADAALLWNRTFLKIFPEHAEDIRVGDPYRANLRRFYERRLDAAEMPSIDRFIEEGVRRHRGQQRPFAFEHRGKRLWVASLPLPNVGRIRIWKAHDDGPFGDVLGPFGSTGAAAFAPTSPAPFDRADLLEQVADGVMVAGADHRIVWANEPFVRLYRLADRSAALGATFEEVYRTAWHGSETREIALFERGLSTLAENLRFAGAPFEVPLPNAGWVRVVEQPGADGRRFFAHVDISELKRQQQQLQHAERRSRASEAVLSEKSRLLEATLERMEQGVMMVNAQRVVEVCNRRAIELLDLPADLMASKPTFEAVLAHQWSTDEFRHTPQEVQEFVKQGGILDRPHCYDRRRPDGRVIEVQSVPIEGGGVLRTYTDITERKLSDERIRHVARHDGLTSLVNREAFLEHLAAAVKTFATARECYAVLYIDLDGFKPVNDRHGHLVGDKVLATAAARMRAIAREGDVVARLGGDEFAILQYRVGNTTNAVGLAERVLAGIRAPMAFDSTPIVVGASIGIAMACRVDIDADTLLRNADAAMYQAKAAGRDCVRVAGRARAPEEKA